MELEYRIIRAEDWPRKKTASLLKRLALERRLLKDQAIEFLWPEADLTSGANNLYKTIHGLRQTLNTVLGAGAAEAIFRFEDGVLSLSGKKTRECDLWGVSRSDIIQRATRASGSQIPLSGSHLVGISRCRL